MGRGTRTIQKATKETRSSSLDKAISNIRSLKPGVLPETKDLIELCSLNHGGIRTTDEIAKVVNPTTSEEIELRSTLMQGDEIVGESTIWINWDGEDKQYLRFKLSFLKLDEGARGKGFGDYRHKEYERRWEAGVDRIEIWADEIGSYKWASHGYEFDCESLAPRPSYMMPSRSKEEVQDRVRVASAKEAANLFQKKESWIDMLVSKGDVSRELVEELKEKLIQTDYTDDFDTQLQKSEGKISSPKELVEFGKDKSWINEEGHKSWLGKDVLMYNPWRGVKYLNGDPWDLLADDHPKLYS